MKKMKILKEMEYEATACACCSDENNFEKIWLNRVIAETQQSRWQFDNQLIICKCCGYVFTSPMPSEKMLLEYYSDTWAYYSDQEIDYNIENRIDFIKKNLKRNNVFVEIGSNKKNIFQERLMDIFIEVHSVEPNENIESDFKSIDQIPSEFADMIAHYFVLEHIPHIDKFLTRCNETLKDGGIMICEVPDITLYPHDISGLILHEHLNHFSIQTLTRICNNFGFQLLDHSSRLCSRNFGFAAAFQKTGAIVQKGKEYELNEYRKNKKIIKGGVKKIQEYREKIQHAYNKLEKYCQMGKKIILWGANLNLKRFLDVGDRLPEEVIIIDSDPDKKTFSDQHNVCIPSEKIGDIRDSNIIFIFSRRNSKDILNYVNDTMDKEFDEESIIIVDN